EPLTNYLSKPPSHFLENRLNEADDAMLITGYYEDILVSNNLNSKISDMKKRPDNWVQFPQLAIAKRTFDWRGYEFRTNFEDIHKDVAFNTNSWGFRDKEYALPKPPNTFRIGVFGGSFVAGAGTAQEDLFHTIINQTFNTDSISGKRIEMVNMATPSYHILHNTYMAEQKGLDKDLDVIAVVSHALDYGRAYKTLQRIVKQDSVPYPFIRQLVEKYEYVDTGQNWRSDQLKYPGLGRELAEHAYQHLAEVCEREGIVPMYIYWPRAPEEIYDAEELENTIKYVQELGYLVLDLRNVFDGMDSKSLYLAPFDRHPNKLAHRLIAEGMVRQLRASKEIADLFNKQ
ncbi:MAG: hypothetical protein AAGJ93_08830, partial [Bacteroidota bacterium]